jgi:Skp family chaperone for outer membrane proteins
LNNNGVEEHITTTIKTTTTYTTSTFETTGQNENNELNQLIKTHSEEIDKVRTELLQESMSLQSKMRAEMYEENERRSRKT